MITGIIAEFNPFHNGHKYIIEQAKKRTRADYLIIAMSGDFVQRGAPSIIDKTIRTKACLLNGADLVIELPVIGSTATAEEFALAGVKALHEAGINTLAFGCETENIAILDLLSDLFIEEPDEYKYLLQKSLKEGISFPLARAGAAVSFFNTHKEYLSLNPKTILQKAKLDLKEIASVLDGPNNILAIEYLKAIKRLDLPIDICPIKRIGVGHHAHFGLDKYTSATALRKAIKKIDLTSIDTNSTRNLSVFFEGIDTFIPNNFATELISYLSLHAPLSEDDMSLIAKYELINSKPNGIKNILDCNEDLSNRLINNLESFISFSDFCQKMNTKESTYARIARILTHLVLHISNDDMASFKRTPCPYLRILGFRKDASSLLGMIKIHSLVPIITSVKEAERSLDGFALECLKKDIMARDIYNSLDIKRKDAESTLPSDYTMQLIVI